MIAVGLGFSSRCSSDELVTLVRETLTEIEGSAVLLCTHSRKAGAPVLEAAARELGLPLRFLEQAELAAIQDEAETRSERAVAEIGLASLAEAAALLGAGKHARLLVPRRACAHATCAIASGGDSR